MKMLPNNWESLGETLGRAGDASASSVFAAEETIPWNDLHTGTMLGGRREDLRGQSVLVATVSQLHTVAALVELDGFARRIVLYPSDLSLDHLSHVIQSAAADVIVTDRVNDIDNLGVAGVTPSRWTAKVHAPSSSNPERRTEWVLLTSGTTGRPKLVVHTLPSLAGAIDENRESAGKVIWSTFYDIRRYGGLQIFLRAALTGKSLVLSSAEESPAEFLERASRCGVTHISGTPSHWRRALMSSAAHLITPAYVRLSGEIADQAVLNHLQEAYPHANIGHAFATTEAGVVFAVNDHLMGFPAGAIEHTPDVAMKVEDRSLRVRSSRTAQGYLVYRDGASQCVPVADAEGFVDTGDVIELHEGRYHFVGRGDGMINVGGMKVYPEEVEAILNGHPRVQVSLVRTKKNPITGALVVADVVLKNADSSTADDMRALHSDILRFCRETLPPHKVPATINFVPTLAVAETGKLIRRHA
jgi:acyl-coenzyme A synthetase/AMP-(fatty) acid ligase